MCVCVVCMCVCVCVCVRAPPCLSIDIIIVMTAYCIDFVPESLKLMNAQPDAGTTRCSLQLRKTQEHILRHFRVELHDEAIKPSDL